jgi:hypothetical protein
MAPRGSCKLVIVSGTLGYSIGVIELVIANSLELITVKSTIAERIKHLLKAE